jgi:hypothetical protein
MRAGEWRWGREVPEGEMFWEGGAEEAEGRKVHGWGVGRRRGWWESGLAVVGGGGRGCWCIYICEFVDGSECRLCVTRETRM